MKDLARIIADNITTIQDMYSAKEVLELLEIAAEGITACQRTISFPVGSEGTEVCYRAKDSTGTYEVVGTCRTDGTFTMFCNPNGHNRVIVQCNLLEPKEVFLALLEEESRRELLRFLLKQIEMAKQKDSKGKKRISIFSHWH